MTSSKKQILEYERKALASIPNDHPHKKEIQELLVDQINDELLTYANSIPTTRTV